MSSQAKSGTEPHPDASRQDWQAVWQPVVDQVGKDFGAGEITWGADEVEAGTIRRYLEPLEFDCPLHYDTAAAQANGYGGIIAPYTSITSFAFPAVWRPGEEQFIEADRDAQPARLSVKPKPLEGGPAVSGFFVVEWNADYLRPVRIGERVGFRGQRLVSCVPKETKVGRGAFVTFDGEIVDAAGEPVVRLRRTLFMYEPRARSAG